MAYYALIIKSAPVEAESMARVIQGIVAGIGFVGGGAILKNDGHVRGLVTC